MNVLIVSLNYSPEPTGIAPYTAGLAEGLLARGHRVSVVTGIPHYPEWRNNTGQRRLRQRETIKGVDVVRLRHYIPRGGIGLGRVLLEATFAVQVSTTRWGRPDVIVTVSPSLFASAAVLVRRWGRRSKTPVVIWVQDLYSRGAVELRASSVPLRLAVSLESAVLRHAQAVVVINHRFRSFVCDELSVAPPQVHELRNWSHVRIGSTTARSHTRARLDWADRPVVLHTGSMGTKQGLEAIVDAARLAQHQGLHTLFVLMGDGSQRSQLEDASIGCRNIRLVPPLPASDFVAALDAADVLLLHERVGVKEMAFPSKLTTYFAAGKPIVAAVDPNGVSAAEIRLAKAGLIVSPGDPQALLDAVSSLICSTVRAQTLGGAGRDYAARNLGAEQVLGRWEDLLAEV